MPLSDREYFANLTRAVFVTGFSRNVINNKWEGFLEAFKEFDPEIISRWDNTNVEKLLKRDDIVRNRRKIEATIHNAQAILNLKSEYGNLHSFIRSLDDLSHDDKVKQLKKPFKFVGPTTATIFLYLSGEKVPEMH